MLLRTYSARLYQNIPLVLLSKNFHQERNYIYYLDTNRHYGAMGNSLLRIPACCMLGANPGKFSQWGVPLYRGTRACLCDC